MSEAFDAPLTPEHGDAPQAPRGEAGATGAQEPSVTEAAAQPQAAEEALGADAPVPLPSVEPVVPVPSTEPVESVPSAGHFVQPQAAEQPVQPLPQPAEEPAQPQEPAAARVFRYAADDLEPLHDAHKDDDDEASEIDEDEVKQDSGVSDESPHLPGEVEDELFPAAHAVAPEPPTTVLPAAATERLEPSLEPTRSWPATASSEPAAAPSEPAAEPEQMPAVFEPALPASALVTRPQRYCPECGLSLQPGARFCPECGTPVAVPQPSDAQFPPLGEASATPGPEPATPGPDPTVPFGVGVGAGSAASARQQEPATQAVPPVTDPTPAQPVVPDQPVVETASATTDREAARSTGPLPIILGVVALVLSVAMAAGVGSCTSVAVHQVLQEELAQHPNGYVPHSYNDVNGYSDELDPELQDLLNQLYGDDYSGQGLTGDIGTSSRTGSYTTADALTDSSLVYLDGYTVSVSAREYSGVQPAVSEFVRAIDSADQEGMERVQRHLRAAASASEDAVRTEELEAARTAVADALKAADEISVPQTASLTDSADATASRISSEASSASKLYHDRWQAYADVIEAVITPRQDFHELAELDSKADYLVDDVSNELSYLLGLAKR